MSFNSIPFEQDDFILAIPSFNWFTNTFQFIDTVKNMPCDSMTCLHKQDEVQVKNLIISTMQNVENQSESEIVEKKGKKGCNCSKTNCLKRYCECFNAGKECTVECACYGCLNDHEHVSYGNKEKMAMNVKAKFKGCTCKKSQCQKKYCECFNAGVGCTDACRCVGCQNHGSNCDWHGSNGHSKMRNGANIKKISLVQNLGVIRNI